jgi:hypothetical protein
MQIVLGQKYRKLLKWDWKYYCNINATDVKDLTSPCSLFQKILCYDDKNLATKEHGG